MTRRLPILALLFVGLSAGFQLYNNIDSAPATITHLATGTVSTSEILGWNSSPYQIVGAQGAGTLIVIQDVVLESNYGGTAFTGGSNILIGYGGSNSFPASGVCSTTVLTMTSSQICIVPTTSFGAGASSGAVNKSITLFSVNAFLGGNSTILYWVRYHILSGLQ